MKKNLPNILTFSRGLATLIIIALFISDLPSKFLLIYPLFIFAVLTDFFDGFLARSWKTISELGMIFDPLFDKVLVLSLLLLIYPFEIISPLIIVVLFLRDIIVDAMRSFMLSKNTAVAAIKIAKLKTASQMLMLNFVLLFLLDPNIDFFRETAVFLSIVALVFSLWSGVIYTKKFIPFLGKNP